MVYKDIKVWTGDNKFELGILSLAIGVLFSVLAFFGGPREGTPDFLLPMVEPLSNPTQWYLWLWLIGPGLLIMGMWYTYSMWAKRKRFEELMSITGRAKFVTNLGEIEELSWDLKRKDRMRVVEKKAELKIKRR